MTLFSDVNDEDPPPGEKGKSPFHGWWTHNTEALNDRSPCTISSLCCLWSKHWMRSKFTWWRVSIIFIIHWFSMLTREFLLAFPNLIRVQKSHTHNTTAAAGERIFDERLSTIEWKNGNYHCTFWFRLDRVGRVLHIFLSLIICVTTMRWCDYVSSKRRALNTINIICYSFHVCSTVEFRKLAPRTLCATGKTKNDIRIIKIRLSRLAFCCPFYGSIMHTQKQHTYIRVGNKVAVTIQLDCEAKSILLI